MREGRADPGRRIGTKFGELEREGVLCGGTEQTDVIAKKLDSSTKLAVDRTRLAYERTLMAWIRTATSLITFGFTIRLNYREEAHQEATG